MKREPLAGRLADAPRWVALLDIEHKAHPKRTARECDVAARIALAGERRARYPSLRTWGPGDDQPSPAPEHGVYDLDGDVWLYQRESGCWRMSSADRRRNAESSEDVEGQRPWVYLLESCGPVTERPGGVATAGINQCPSGNGSR